MPPLCCFVQLRPRYRRLLCPAMPATPPRLLRLGKGPTVRGAQLLVAESLRSLVRLARVRRAEDAPVRALERDLVVAQVAQRGAEVVVAQERLDFLTPQPGPPARLREPAPEAVAGRACRQLHPGPGRQAADHHPHQVVGDGRALVARRAPPEQRPVAVALAPAQPQVVQQSHRRARPPEHHPGLAALADQPGRALGLVERAVLERGQLADPQPALEQQQEHGPVAGRLLVAAVAGGRQQQRQLLLGHGPVTVRVGPAGLLGAEPGHSRAGHPAVEEVAGLGVRQQRLVVLVVLVAEKRPEGPQDAVDRVCCVRFDTSVFVTLIVVLPHFA